MTVLDGGCGTGAITSEIAEMVGANGRCFKESRFFN